MDIACRPRDGQVDAAETGRGLAVGAHLYEVVVGQHEFNRHLCYLAGVWSGIADIGEIEIEHDLFAAVGGQKTAALKAALDQGAEADLGAARLVAL